MPSTAALGSVLVFAFVMILYVTEKLPLMVTALGSAALLASLGLAPAATAWKGLSSDTVIVAGGMTVVGLALSETGVARVVAGRLSALLGGRPEWAAYGLLLLTGLLSGFMNNSATVATILPVMTSLIAGSKGKLNRKRYFLPLALVTNAGGMLTLIGTTPQMVAQETLLTHGYEGFGFFDFAWIGAPMLLLTLVYTLTLGKLIANKLWSEDRPQNRDVPESAHEEEYAETENHTGMGKKQVLMVLILLCAVTAMILEVGASNGTVAMLAAGACIVTGCIPLKTVLAKLDWTTIFVLGGSIGFAWGLEYAGGGQLIADWIMSLFGDALTPRSVFFLFLVLAAVLTQFMSNTAVTAMLIPIALPFVETVGINLMPLMMGICASANMSFSTPIATPCMTMVMEPGGYSFTDYVKYCLPCNILAVALIGVIAPAV